MPRSQALRTAGLAVILVASAAAPILASPQPTGVCPVCGTNLHENVTASEATLEMQANGDVRWRVETELTESTAREWREDPDDARSAVDSAMAGPPVPLRDPTDPTVDVDGTTVTVTFTDRGAARQRLGLLVVPYLHGEGIEYRWVINADQFVVAAPDGQRVLNDPAGATVEDGRAIWRGDTLSPSTSEPRPAVSRSAPEPGPTYVVTGDGAAAETRSAIVTDLEPLDPVLYGYYALGLLFVVGTAFGLYTIEGTHLGRGRVGGVLALVAIGYLTVVASLHPPGGGLGGAFARAMAVAQSLLLALVGGVGLYAWAAVSDSSERVGTR
jgi:hypothetical protein